MSSAVFKLCFRLVLLSVQFALYALYGVYRLAAGLFRLPGRVRSVQRLLAESLTCPWCDEENPLAARWTCRACGAQFLAAATAACPVCHATPSYIPCRHCHGAIVLGGER